MHVSKHHVIAIFLLISSSIAYADLNNNKDQLNLTSTDWCPYICADKGKPGFIVEYMTELLARNGVSLKVDVFPWSRSISLARQGEYDGVLTATESETPDFHLTTYLSGTYQDCLFKRIGSDISYKDRASFQNLVLGGIKDYGYSEPMNSVIANPQEGEKTYLISHADPLKLLIQMADKGRVDLFVEDQAVLNYFIKLNPDQNLVERAGCVDAKPFYTAISPKSVNGEYWLMLLNKALNSMEAKELYEEAKARYSL
jgi:ABC-type amino acid transport substrate-binding protein